MKRCLLILTFLFVSLYGITQQSPPAGVNNTYTLSDRDGYTGFNYAAIYHAPSGKVYTQTYDGDIAIHGNNYTISLAGISRQPSINGSFIEINENEAWYYDSKKIAVIKNDTVYRIINYPTESLLSTSLEKGILVICKKNDHAEVLFFDGQDLLLKNKESHLVITHQSSLIKSVSGTIYFSNSINDSLNIFKLNTKIFSLELLKKYATGNAYLFNIEDENNCIIQKVNGKGEFCKVENGLIRTIPHNDDEIKKMSQIQAHSYPYGISSHDGGYQQIFNIANRHEDYLLPVFLSNDITHLLCTEKKYGSFYVKTGNKPLRVFNTLKRYPFIFNSSNASSVYSVQQNNEVSIWAGSYQGGISIIANNKVRQLPDFNIRITNGGNYLNNYMYLLSEGARNGLLQINEKGTNKFLTIGTNGFYTYVTKNKQHFYYGTGNYNGIWITPVANLEKGSPVWNKIDSSKGITLNNILTITEDSAGRIWCGHSKRGIAIYDPKTSKAKTWLTDKNETPFGAFSSLTDAKGTVWIGSGTKGLWYYNDYSKEPSPLNCKRVNHPLLGDSKSIPALTIYNNWLVISGYDKMMLFSLDSFYQKNKIILRYLNPQEAAFTSFTEQNTSLTSKKDSTVWFSTSDMLYQWNVKQWLTLPTYKVTTDVFIKSNNKKTSLLPGKTISLEPGFNSFDIMVHYLSPDNMPRYTSAALFKEGDSLLLTEPSLQSIYNIKNIGNGRYQFILEVYEMDGTTSRFVYNIRIRKFLWQQWWFWAALSTLLIGTMVFFINQKRKRQLAEQKVKTKEAELLSFKREQEKKLANLQLVTLSSQFRPHFILNALNTIGAQMDDKPEAESVLSRLSESVSLIFNHAQQQKILHPFENEWSLVTNVIHIHQLMYLKKLETNLPDIATIEHIKYLNVPLGILQIPVENALLHGLSNKESGSWNLSIAISETESFFTVRITDYGVGRKKSAKLSNFTKHGTGTKNLNEIINIINAANADKISITYEDDIYTLNEETFGTCVIIKIPKQLTYVNE